MLTRDQFLELCRHEVNCLKHLYTKLPKDKLSYRPTPAQRSLGELLEFMPCNLTVVADCFIKGDFSQFGAHAEKIQVAVRGDFNKALDAEMEKFAALISSIPEKDFQTKEVAFPTGQKFLLGPGLVASVYRFLSAYKMQFFLYLKSCGCSEIGSANLWMGFDRPKKS